MQTISKQAKLTPTMEEIGNLEGEGVKDPGNSRWEGGCMIELVFRGPNIDSVWI